MTWRTTQPQPIATATQLSAAIGSTADLPIERITVAVEIIDSRERWGSQDFLVRPLAGSGSQWVSAMRLTNMQPSREE